MFGSRKYIHGCLGGKGLTESGNERTFKCDRNVLYLDLEL